MTSLKSMTSLNRFFFYAITDPTCFLINYIKSEFGEETTTDGGQKYSLLNDVAL